MMPMPVKMVEKKVQEFNPNRIKDISLCSKCKNEFMQCNEFMHCPKENYISQLTVYRYSLQEFKDYYGDNLTGEWYKNTDILDDFINLFEFPESVYHIIENNTIKLFNLHVRDWSYCVVDLSTGIVHIHDDANIVDEYRAFNVIVEFANKIGQALMDLK